MAFVKLDCGLLDSSLWTDQDASRMFLTALLMAVPREIERDMPQVAVRSLEVTGWTVPAGWYGFVSAAGVGIAGRAHVEREAALAALERLSAPDPDSRGTDFGGRRLARVDGGWVVLNWARYRERDMTAAERSRRWRERNIGALDVDSVPEPDSNDTAQRRDDRCERPCATVPSQKEKKKEKKKKEEKEKERPEQTAARKGAVEEWMNRFPGATPPASRIWKALRPLVEKHGWAEVGANWCRYLREQDEEFISPQSYAAKYPWTGKAKRGGNGAVPAGEVEHGPWGVRPKMPEFEAAPPPPKVERPEADRDAAQKWAQVCARVECSDHVRESWLGAVVPVGMADESTIRLWTANPGTADYLRNQLRGPIKAACDSMGVGIVFAGGGKS